MGSQVDRAPLTGPFVLRISDCRPMSICRSLRLLFVGSLLLVGLGSVASPSAVAQSSPERSASRSSSPNDLPAWAEPRASSRGNADRSSAAPSREDQLRTKNPGFPGGGPGQEVPIGGGGAALLAAAGAAYGIRRLGDDATPDGGPPSD